MSSNLPLIVLILNAIISIGSMWFIYHSNRKSALKYRINDQINYLCHCIDIKANELKNDEPLDSRFYNSIFIKLDLLDLEESEKYTIKRDIARICVKDSFSELIRIIEILSSHKQY